jgi:hypothetical protein
VAAKRAWTCAAVGQYWSRHHEQADFILSTIHKETHSMLEERSKRGSSASTHLSAAATLLMHAQLRGNCGDILHDIGWKAHLHPDLYGYSKTLAAIQSILRAVRSIRIVASQSVIDHRLQIRSHATSSAEDRLSAGDFPWLRMYVLKRDQYRCRACHRRGAEITLHVDWIGTLPSNVHSLMTRCASCYRIAQVREFSGGRMLASLAKVPSA